MKSKILAVAIMLGMCMGGLVFSAGNASASKWLEVSVTTDKKDYFQGETVTITIRPTNTDTGTTDYIDVMIFRYTTKLIEWVNQSAMDPTVLVWAMPSDVKAGQYDITVREAGSWVPIPKDSVENGVFNVHNTAEIYPEISFDKNSYLSGETISISVNVISSGKIFVPGPYLCNYSISYGSKLETADGRDQKYSFPVPYNFVGKISVGVVVTALYFAYEGVGTKSVEVYYGILVVNTDKHLYRGGENISVTYRLLTKEMTSPSYSWVILDAQGNLVYSSPAQSGTPTGGSFLFAVPNNPSASYIITVYAKDNSITVSEMVGVDRTDQIYISAWVSTPSKYTTFSYSPGETITIHYKISVISPIRMPRWFHIVYGINDYYGLNPEVMEVNTSEGDLTYTIPSEVSDGNHILVVEATPYDSTSSFQSITAIRVDSNPSSLQSNIGGGMSMMELVLLILIIVLLMLVIILFMKKESKPKVPKPPKESPPVKQAPQPVQQQVVYQQQPQQQVVYQQPQQTVVYQQAPQPQQQVYYQQH